MTLLQSLILGIIQGATEFLPVSSSGHLLLAKKIFDLKEIDNSFDIFLHFGTLVAVFIFFRKKIISILRGILARDKDSIFFVLTILLASLPTALIGFLIEKNTGVFSSLISLGISFLVTASFLVIISMKKGGKGGVNLKSSFLVGTLQGLAAIPGISRSGSTIFAGIISGASRRESFEFSFLVSVPAILGANLLKVGDIFSGKVELLHLLSGGVLAFISGLFSLFFLEKTLVKGRLIIFSPYLLVLSILCFLFM